MMDWTRLASNLPQNYCQKAPKGLYAPRVHVRIFEIAKSAENVGAGGARPQVRAWLSAGRGLPHISGSALKAHTIRYMTPSCMLDIVLCIKQNMSIALVDKSISKSSCY